MPNRPDRLPVGHRQITPDALEGRDACGCSDDYECPAHADQQPALRLTRYGRAVLDSAPYALPADSAQPPLPEFALALNVYPDNPQSGYARRPFAAGTRRRIRAGYVLLLRRLRFT